MANIVYNKLKLIGNSALIAATADLIKKDNNGLFNIFMPIPPILKVMSYGGKNIKDVEYSTWYTDYDKNISYGIDSLATSALKKLYNASNWYDYNIKTYDTKWDACGLKILKQTEDTLYLSFETAWTPPTKFYEFIDSIFENVEAYYLEEDCKCGAFVNGFLEKRTYERIYDKNDTLVKIESPSYIRREFADLINSWKEVTE